MLCVPTRDVASHEANAIITHEVLEVLLVLSVMLFSGRHVFARWDDTQCVLKRKTFAEQIKYTTLMRKHRSSYVLAMPFSSMMTRLCQKMLRGHEVGNMFGYCRCILCPSVVFV